jgi:hypothetical protein
MISAYLWWPACVFFCFARKAMGAACTRHSLRPLFSRGTRFSQNSDANRAAGMLTLVIATKGGLAIGHVKGERKAVGYAEPVIGRAFARPVG